MTMQEECPSEEMPRRQDRMHSSDLQWQDVPIFSRLQRAFNNGTDSQEQCARDATGTMSKHWRKH
jgi:hypothetical protein